jgi:uncharacterized membrane protein YfcA
VDLSEWAGLAATTFAAALLYAVSGFGFAVLAAPLFLLFVGPAAAIQLVIIISAALALVVVPGLRRAVAPGLLLRLTIGCLAGLPIGLVAFRHSNPLLVRGGVGATILAFSALTAMSWRRRGNPKPAEQRSPLAMSPGRDLTAGAFSGIATALVGMAGPPVVIYLLLTGVTPRTARATLLAYFALSYAATLFSHVATIGVPAPTWLAAGILIPFAFLGGFAGRPLGDRLGAEAFTILAIALLATTGLYTIAAAAISFAAHRQ